MIPDFAKHYISIVRFVECWISCGGSETEEEEAPAGLTTKLSRILTTFPYLDMFSNHRNHSNIINTL